MSINLLFKEIDMTDSRECHLQDRYIGLCDDIDDRSSVPRQQKLTHESMPLVTKLPLHAYACSHERLDRQGGSEVGT